MMLSPANARPSAPVASQVSLILVTPDVLIERVILSVLRSEPALSLVRTCKDTVALVNLLERNSAPIVLADIDQHPEQILRELEYLGNRFPGIRFVALAQDLTADLALLAMHSGVRHFQVKARINTELVPTLYRLMPADEELTGEGGAALTVLSASGGCGATTVAVNLANELQLATAQAVLVVDLDASYGTVGTYLDLRGEYGVSDVLTPERRIDAELIATTALKRSDHLHALIRPLNTGFATADPIFVERLDSFVRACKLGYGFTLFDAPRMSVEAATVLAKASQKVLIVLQSNIKDIRVTRAMLDALVERGVIRDRIYPIVNRVRRRYQMITLREVQQALNVTEVGQLQNDFKSAVRSINYGKPLAEATPRSKLRRGLMQLAKELSALYAGNNGKLRAHATTG
ncbi:MAG: AAA family ATPase [Candidatus Hydrogenedentes bacterium]|nr:AAA family ATPase [Candidatus Hydrogenedentota bacterium]